MTGNSLEEGWVTVRTNFEKAFEDLNSYYLQLCLPGFKNRSSVYQIDELVLTSGKLIACDPLLPLEPGELYFRPLNINLPPGRYPVILSLTTLEFGQVIACAMLRLSEQPPVKWELAKSVNGNDFTYGVDSGTGCFMDVDAAQFCCHLSYSDLQILDRYGIEVNAEKPELWKLCAIMDENVKRVGIEWASIKASDSTEANIVAFKSGLGDGGYASWLGYDKNRNIVCIVTDFMVNDSWIVVHCD